MRTDTVNKKINRGSVPLRENVKQIVAVLDFGGQYSHLIVRRCRDSKVYAELFPHDITVERLKAVSPSAIVLSGGPASVYAENSPMCDTGIFALGVPVLGICYGAQLIAQMKGGRVEKARRAEYGKMELFVENDSDLFKGISSPTTVWMSHGDRVESLPANFEVLAHTENAPIAAFRSGNIYGIQFHLEVVHTVRGKEILENFLYRICGLNANWTPGSFAESAVREIKEKIASGKVICALSGGIDSSV